MNSHEDEQGIPYGKPGVDSPPAAREARDGEEATGPNPNYVPPQMVWNIVEVIAPEGFTFAIVCDNGGTLGLAMKPPGGEWSTDLPRDGENTIAPGHKAYCVRHVPEAAHARAAAPPSPAEAPPINDDVFGNDGGMKQCISGFGENTLRAIRSAMRTVFEERRLDNEEFDSLAWHVRELVRWCRGLNRESQERAALLAAATAQVRELEKAVQWACGGNGHFPTREEGQGAYWWRTELRRRAALPPSPTEAHHAD